MGIRMSISALPVPERYPRAKRTTSSGKGTKTLAAIEMRNMPKYEREPSSAISVSVPFKNYIISLLGVVLTNESKSFTLFCGTSCSTNSVNIVFVSWRKIIVYNMTNVVNVDTTSSYVCCNQYIYFSALKSF